MNLGLSGRLYLIIAVSVIAIGIGYWFSYSLRTKVTETWKQTLWEDCTNRMREIDVKKIHILSPTVSSDIKIETEDKTLHLKKDGTTSLTTAEKDFLADQYYLSLKNPVKIETLDSLFRLKLMENGFTFKTAVSLYNNETAKKTFYGQEDVKVLHDYLKLTYKVDIRDVILLEGYVKGGWLENLLWGKGYYILLSLIIFGALVLLVLEKKKLKCLKQSVPENKLLEAIPLTLPVEFVRQNVELITEPVLEEKHIQPGLNLQPTAIVIFLDEEKHSLVYEDKVIPLAPKVFGLFYLLAQGKDYFQSYDFLLQNLWSDEETADKKHLEQLVIRLRKDLKDIPWLNIDTIRGSGYQIKGENDIKIIIKQIEYNNE
ncbi:winged helix-turn-helix domain-containing protein [uncultured Parabacteroides sp.]|jgi:DNA-binding winged helix-turn-helix (wHTH) protein|uniref:winged helix-turn-helix domain-containing protein n=1 Tax=uncultured Parabacteroides sp. TaxID=512312 RepID=UPI0025D9B069|nr:winged helix-turn-helix domain-containing protein [uncultured Parabacteroides sp.]